MPKACSLLVKIAGVLLALTTAVAAQDYPTKPVRLIIPFPPGGSNDVVGRMIALQLSDRLGKQVVVDNRGGAGGIIGTEAAANAPHDGYTLLIISIAHAVSPWLYKLQYDPIKSFVPVAILASGSNVLVVNPELPVHSVGELITLAKQKPGELNYASAGIGSFQHMGGELFKLTAAVDIVHVPYKGGILSVNDLIAGHVQIVFSDALPVMQHIRAGTLRALAVTSPERSALAPEIPTCFESGLPGLVAVNWWGVLLPAGTPKAIAEKFRADLVKVMQDPEVKEKFASLGVDAVSGTPEQFGAYIKSETAKYAQLIKDQGIKGE
jgi:tripartite-type tricarboxylate transporter receptor subunit TctC